MVESMRIVRRCLLLVACALAFTVMGCGHSGGGGFNDDDVVPQPSPSPSPVPNTAPIAVIGGLPEKVVPGQGVTLDGSSSHDPDGDSIASYAWKQAGGSAVEMQEADHAQMTFVVPNETTTIVMELSVTDSRGAASEPARIEIPVIAVDDDEKMTAVVVSASAGSDDPKASGSSMHPVKTITRGIAIAKERGLGIVYVMEGTYMEEVPLSSGIRLVGGVVSVGIGGSATFAAPFAGTTIIQAPPKAAQAVSIKNAMHSSIEGFRIAGAFASPFSYGVRVEDSKDVKILGNIIETPGASGATQCRDVSVKGSALDANQGIAVFGNRFRSSGVCNDYIGIDVETAQGVRLAHGGEGNRFAFAPAGAEHYLKAVQVRTSDDVEVASQEVNPERIAVPATAAVTGIVVSDTTNAAVEGNAIAIDGGKQAVGVLLRCEAAQMATAATGNAIDLVQATEKQHGVVIVCTREGSSFDISANRIRILPSGGVPSTARGVEVQAELRSLTVGLTNNIVVLKTADQSDAAGKTAVVLSKLGKNSTVDLRHNTMLVTGNSGDLAVLSSDRADVKFSAINNILFVYGSGPKNAILSQKANCEQGAAPAYCAKQIESNLIDAKMKAVNLPLTYFNDLAQLTFQPMSVANECDTNPALPQCASQTVVRTANVLENLLVPSSFDLDAGTLVALKQSLAIDKGHDAGVGVDIDGNPRRVMPDIGATEY